MPIPKPNKGEKQNDYMGRCITLLKDEGKFTDNKQRVAICFSQWRDNTNEETISGDVAPVEKRINFMNKRKNVKDKIKAVLDEATKMTKKSKKKLNGKELVDLFGGKDYFKKFFDNSGDAIAFVYDQLATFDLKEKNIDKKSFEKEIKSMNL